MEEMAWGLGPWANKSKFKLIDRLLIVYVGVRAYLRRWSVSWKRRRG